MLRAVSTIMHISVVADILRLKPSNNRHDFSFVWQEILQEKEANEDHSFSY